MQHAYSGSRTVVVVAIVNTNTESMRVSTDMGYVDVVASKRGFLRGGQLASSGGGIAAGCVALTLPQVRYCARETARERRR